MSVFSGLTPRLRFLLVTITGIGALVLLAASVSNLEFSAGYRLASPSSNRGLPFSLPQDLLDVLLAITFLIAPILMLVGVLYGLAASGFRARALLWFVWVGLLVAGLYYAMRLYPGMLDHLPRVAGPRDPVVVTPVATVVAGDLGEFEANSPAWAEPVVAIGVALLVSLGIVAGGWFVVRRLFRPASPADDLADEAHRALTALRAGADVRDTVMRCYFEMGRVLDQHYGLVRTEAMTPREFEQMLAGVDLPGAQVARLTRLFEMVRYGSRAATRVQEQEAVACLSAIAHSRRKERPVAAEGQL